MRGRMRVPLFAVALALLGLIGAARDAAVPLAWAASAMRSAIGCVRRSRPARPHSRSDFDAELTRGLPALPDRSLGRRRGSADRFCRPLRPLARDVEVPAPRQGVLCLHAGRDAAGSQKFDPATRPLAPVEWPASMQDWRDHVVDTRVGAASTLRDGGDVLHPPESDRRSGSRCRRSSCPRRCCSAADPRPATGTPSAPRLVYTILEIDEELHVARDAAGARRAALHAEQRRRCPGWRWSAGAGGRVIYHSSEAFNPAPGTHADATADLFAIRTQDFGRVASGDPPLRDVRLTRSD